MGTILCICHIRYYVRPVCIPKYLFFSNSSAYGRCMWLNFELFANWFNTNLYKTKESIATASFHCVRSCWWSRGESRGQVCDKTNGKFSIYNVTQMLWLHSSVFKNTKYSAKFRCSTSVFIDCLRVFVCVCVHLFICLFFNYNFSICWPYVCPYIHCDV